ncbi:histone-lysine N-methyltransferase SETD1B isoform X1 [Vespula squamosa]|uniref:Histone-lysine N-methyltransferase SETD1B isoform X1 n=1 Tax=Vespula squamosa TaxID=30214 RepID=A0ABD2ATW2_VESSQ
MKIATLLLVIVAFASGQRITTIQLDGVQYFVSRMNPYSPELNYFLAYQYCRSLGLQLASFETKEKSDTMTQYLKNAGYTKYDFWTSGNKLGTDMFLWMSTGLPFNTTFDYMLKRPGNRPADVPPGTEPQRVARESGDSGSEDGCVAMIAPTLAWEAQDCTLVKDFICEQTRCYYYNYGSIPVSATQGNRRPYITTTSAPASDDQIDEHVEEENKEEKKHDEVIEDKTTSSSNEEKEESANEDVPEDPVVSRLITTAASVSGKLEEKDDQQEESTASSLGNIERRRQTDAFVLENTRPDDIPDITSLFTANNGDGQVVRHQARKDNSASVFDGLETREVLRTASRPSTSDMKMEHRDSLDYDVLSDAPVDAQTDVQAETEPPNNGLEDAHTIGPYDTVQDYVNDQQDIGESAMMKDQDDDSSTILPEAEPAYRYNIKVRTNGKVLDPPSK